MPDLLKAVGEFLADNPKHVLGAIALLGLYIGYEWKIKKTVNQLITKVDGFWDTKAGKVALPMIMAGLFVGIGMYSGVVPALWLATFPPEMTVVDPVATTAVNMVSNVNIKLALDIAQGVIGYGGLLIVCTWLGKTLKT